MRQSNVESGCAKCKRAVIETSSTWEEARGAQTPSRFAVRHQFRASSSDGCLFAFDSPTQILDAPSQQTVVAGFTPRFQQILCVAEHREKKCSHDLTHGLTVFCHGRDSLLDGLGGQREAKGDVIADGACYKPNTNVGLPCIAERTLTSPSSPAPAAMYNGTK